jgi:hypothetical protein
VTGIGKEAEKAIRQDTSEIPSRFLETTVRIEGGGPRPPRVAFREINAYARYRLTQHLRRHSQRPFRPPEGVGYYEQISDSGWCAYKADNRQLPVQG